MQVYKVQQGQGVNSLQQVSAPALPAPEDTEVKIKVKAVSLNYRGLMVVNGLYPVKADGPVIAASDFAGEVVETGDSVSRFKPGDRVMANFFPDWIDGPFTFEKVARSFGGDSDGVLVEELTLPESSLVAVPDALTYEEASILPCAGVTAWNSLFAEHHLEPGDSVLLLGTGGVSITALQLAKAAGLKVIITSSSDEKLIRARELGADETINYKANPDWEHVVMERTQGKGVNLVLEVGGKDTVHRSLHTLAANGTIAMIGGLSGFSAQVDPVQLLFGVKRMRGVYVGSRHMLEGLSRLVEQAGIKPVIDQVFPFDQAQEAYQHLASGQHFGKVVIAVNRRLT